MRVVADEQRVAELIDTLARGVEDSVSQAGGEWALVGLKSRGDPFAGRVGSLDITLYRDDLSEIGPQPIVQTTDIPFAIDDLNVMLIDDVLMSGRTIRAALQALIDFGRPRRVWLAVLADRGGRELPIQPDFAALDLTDMPGADKLKLTIRPIHDQDQLLAVPAPGRGDAR